MKNKLNELLGKVRSKAKVVEVVKSIDPTELTKEGRSIVSYLLVAFSPQELSEWTLSDMKEEFLTLLDANSFVDNNKAYSIIENSIKKVVNKTSKKKVSDEDAQKLLDVIQGDSKTKGSEAKPQVNKTTVNNNKGLSEQDIINLCGYRYTYPEFPQTFESPLYKGKVFEMLTTDDVKEVSKMWDATLEDDSIDYDLAVVMYFPEYERNFEIDPHGVLSPSQTKKSLLKAYGGNYPNNLDVQTIVNFNPISRTMCSVSVYTGIPYVVSCQQAFFEVNDKLKCRVTQNGLDYQLYKIVNKK